MIEALLPPGVVGVDAFVGPGDEASGGALFPEEQAALGPVAEGRLREFTDVRRCARRALGILGVGPVPLVPDGDGVPGWPPGVVGSMTHCRGFRAAVVARAGSVRAVGVDAEPWRPLRDGVLETVSVSAERRRHAELVRERPEVCWDRLLFCAKEAVYKAWFPRHRVAWGFRDVVVTFAPDGDTFAAAVPGAPVLTGRWLAGRGVLAAAVVAQPAHRRVSAGA